MSLSSLLSIAGGDSEPGEEARVGVTGESSTGELFDEKLRPRLGKGGMAGFIMSFNSGVAIELRRSAFWSTAASSDDVVAESEKIASIATNELHTISTCPVVVCHFVL